MSHTTLVGTEELARHLDDPDWIVVDARFELGDTTAGRRAYEEAHVPGAVYADLERDLSAMEKSGRGRHPLPDAAVAAERFGALGIGDGAQVVVYDAGDGAIASRVWWMLRYLGHERVAVLDGGFAAWRAEGRPVRGGVERREARAFRGAPRTEMIATAEEVERIRGDASWRLVDSRSPDRYRGENETIDPVAGHIPGATNRFFKRNVGEDGRMRERGELRRELGQLVGDDPSRAVFYCGSGVTACQNLLAMEHAGLSGARLFPGSWSEWISDPSRRVATGEEGA